MLEFDETYKDYRIVGIMTEMGHRCGYISIPKHHFLHGKLYSDRVSFKNYWDFIKNRNIDDKTPIIPLFCAGDMENRGIPIDILLAVHGGITYSRKSDSFPVKTDTNQWWIGFDCAHDGDGSTKHRNLLDGVIRSKEYVRNELHNLVDQLIKVNEVEQC